MMNESFVCNIYQSGYTKGFKDAQKLFQNALKENLQRELKMKNNKFDLEKQSSKELCEGLGHAVLKTIDICKW